MDKKIGILVGSLRKGSFTKMMAYELIQLASDKHQYTIIEIEQLPFYNQDFDAEEVTPEVIQYFRKEIEGYDAFIFMTPEYNRSIPGVLKNALDVASRPYGKNKWDKKPAAIISTSIGQIGGFGANHHLRQCLTFLNMPTLQQPEMYVGGSGILMTEEGTFKEQKTQEFFQSFIKTFEDWITKF